MEIIETLPSSLDVVPVFINIVMERLENELSLKEEDHFDIKLALEEALTNAIKHGNKLDPSRFVEASVMTQGNRVIIHVKNEGSGFDHQKIPNPTSEDKLMKTSGRGVFLIKKIMNEVSFEDQGREIRMVKILKGV